MCIRDRYYTIGPQSVNAVQLSKIILSFSSSLAFLINPIVPGLHNVELLRLFKCVHVALFSSVFLVTIMASVCTLKVVVKSYQGRLPCVS